MAGATAVSRAVIPSAVDAEAVRPAAELPAACVADNSDAFGVGAGNSPATKAGPMADGAVENGAVEDEAVDDGAVEVPPGLRRIGGTQPPDGTDAGPGAGCPVALGPTDPEVPAAEGAAGDEPAGVGAADGADGADAPDPVRGAAEGAVVGELADDAVEDGPDVAGVVEAGAVVRGAAADGTEGTRPEAAASAAAGAWAGAAGAEPLMVAAGLRRSSAVATAPARLLPLVSLGANIGGREARGEVDTLMPTAGWMALSTGSGPGRAPIPTGRPPANRRRITVDARRVPIPMEWPGRGSTERNTGAAATVPSEVDSGREKSCPAALVTSTPGPAGACVPAGAATPVAGASVGPDQLRRTAEPASTEAAEADVDVPMADGAPVADSFSATGDVVGELSNSRVTAGAFDAPAGPDCPDRAVPVGALPVVAPTVGAVPAEPDGGKVAGVEVGGVEVGGVEVGGVGVAAPGVAGAAAAVEVEVVGAE